MRTADSNIFTFYLPTRIIHGPGSVQETGNQFRALGSTKALVITDKGVRAAGLAEGVLQSLQKNKIPYVVFDDVEEDPGGATVAKGAKLAVKEKCNGIVVIGGGSPICAARGMGVVATNGGEIQDYAGINKATKPPLPLIAIPTTAGSGTEVSQFIVLKAPKQFHTKMVAGSPMYFPRVAILDPLLLKSLPFGQAVASGVDALGHAVEACWASFATPITDALALKAVSMLSQNLRSAAMSDDIDAKEACLIASTMANMACGNSRLGLVHTMSSPVEVMFKVPHGIAVGILLPHIMEFNLPASHERFATLAQALGESGDGISTEELALGGLAAMKELLIDLQFPRKFSEPQVDRKAIPELASIVMGGPYGIYDRAKKFPMTAPVPSFNLRKATMADMIGLYEKAFDEWEL